MGRFIKIIRDLRLLLKEVKQNASAALVILLFKGLTEGVGLLFVLPLLAIAGVSELDTSNSQLIKFIQQNFETMGLSISVTTVLIIYFLIMCFYAILSYSQGLITVQINKRVVDRWRNILFERITYASWSSLQRIKGSDLQALLTSDVRRFASISNQTIQLVGTLILMTIYLFLSFTLSIQLTLMSFIPIGILVFLSGPINKKTFKVGEDSVKHNKSMQSSIVEHLASIKLVKSYQKEHEHLVEFQENSLATEKQAVAFVKASGRTKLLFDVLASFVIVVYIFIAFNTVSLPISELLLLIFIFARIIPRVSKLARAYQQILNNLPSFEATQQAIHILSQEKEPTGTLSSSVFKKELKFENVSFSYGSKEVLRNFNCSIPANKTTIILGSSGAGKSTLIDLLMGFLKVESGSILVDNTSLSELDPASWKSGIAYVPQDAFLFHKSIRENLRWVDSTVDESALWNALEQAGGQEFVQLLPNGLDTVVGDRGMQISGGERQRIALARALLRKPQLLILDEATNAIDDKNEELIYNALEHLKNEMTILIVAHRSSLVKLAEKVIRL